MFRAYIIMMHMLTLLKDYKHLKHNYEILFKHTEMGTKKTWDSLLN